MTERDMIFVARRSASFASGSQHRSRAAIISAEVMEPRDVVVCLSNQDRHVVLRGKASSFFISGRRGSKIIEPHVQHGHIVQRNRDRLGIVLFVNREVLMRTLVAFQGVLETVSAVEDVAEIQVQPCYAPSISLLGEDLARFPRCRKSLPIAALQNERLNERTQSARHLFGAA